MTYTIVHSPIQINAGDRDLPVVERLLDFNFKRYKRLHFPEYKGRQTNRLVPGATFLWEWIADVSDSLILATPLDAKETFRADLAREFEEANPGVEYPFYWVGDELFHKEDKALS